MPNEAQTETTQPDKDDLAALFERDPLSLTRSEKGLIVADLRSKRAKFVASEKVTEKKKNAPRKAAPIVDIEL